MSKNTSISIEEIMLDQIHDSLIQLREKIMLKISENEDLKKRLEQEIKEKGAFKDNLDQMTRQFQNLNAENKWQMAKYNNLKRLVKKPRKVWK